MFSLFFVCFTLQTLQIQQQNDAYEELKAYNNEERRLFVKEMALNAWKAYARYAWGQDALEPVTKSAYQQWLGPNGGLTLIQSLSTLHVMGFHEEYQRARDWVMTEFNFSSINQPVNVFVVVTEVIGSFLSNYALTGDKLFLSKAHQIARILAPAYDTTDGLSYKKFNPTTGELIGDEVWLGEAGGQWLEYKFLTNATGDREIGSRIDRIREFFERVDLPKGLYLASLDANTGMWSTDKSSLLAKSSTFYSYLMKAYKQSGGRDTKALEIYREAMQGVEKNSLIHNSAGGLLSVREFDTLTDRYSEFMQHDSCYLGAMLALGADAFSQEMVYEEVAELHFRLAQNITETCYNVSLMSKTRLPPEYLFFYDIKPISDMAYNRFYLSSELAESYFVLWRLTHDNKYREYSWELVESLWNHTRLESGGFSNIDNVDQVPTLKINYQPPHFLSSTLKYLFLTFSDDQTLPMDEWIFNRAGQPLPICGHNAMFPALECR